MKSGKIKKRSSKLRDKTRTIMLDGQDHPMAVFQLFSTNQLRNKNEPTPPLNIAAKKADTPANAKKVNK